MRVQVFFCLFVYLLFSSCISSAQYELDDSDAGNFSFTVDSSSTETRSLAFQNNQKSPAYNKLIDTADEALKSPLYAITEKPKTPSSGSKHDYMSLARYAWPNPETENGLPYIIKDGKVNPEIEDYDRIRLNKMSKKVLRLGLAYQFSKEERYASKAASLIKTWFFKEDTFMNPHFKFGQSIPGVRKGGSAGLIESRDFIKVIEASSLIYGSSHWAKEDHLKLKRWFKNFLEWMLTSKIGAGQKDHKNNHGTWYDAQIATYASFLGKKKLAKSALDRMFSNRVYQQITPSGKQPLELSRWTSQQYTWFNLDGILTNALIYKNITDGADIESRNRIKKALNWLLPYASGQKDWDYEQISLFSTCKYLRLYTKAYNVFGDKKYRDTAEHLISSGCSNAQALLLYPL